MDTSTRVAAGAWKVPTAYRRGGPVLIGWQAQRVRYAVIAIQRELIAQSYLRADPSKLDGGFGLKTDAAVKAFQRDEGLFVDGLFGPKSARRLWSSLYAAVENDLGIADHLLYGQGGLESAFDPGAEGGNPQGWDYFDRGIQQFNRHYHPEISDATAFGDVTACILLAGRSLRDAYDSLGGWDYAIANHNNPAGALAWSEGQVPTDQLREYVRLVRAAAAVPA